MKEKFYQNGLRFECTACGNCCTNSSGYVELNEVEAVKIADYLSLTEDEFVNQFLEAKEDNRWHLNSLTNGDCVFLTDNRCTIYPVRPLQCRTFPFWSENVKSAYRWKLTTQECPGINQGRLYSREEIEKILKEEE